jgi:uncharacterized membrane protein YfcA
MTIVQFIALFLCAFGASVFGSVVGLGGGFVMTPILRVFFFVAPVLASTASLFLVFCNTAAASFGFMKDKKVDFQLALFLAAGAIPGSIIGVLASHQVTIAQFDIIYGVLLIFLAVATMRRRGVASRPPGEPTFLHKPVFALSAGIVMGIASSLFGVGGGIIVVPLMLIAARMPPHIAAATSSFVILLSAPVGIIAHVVAGDADWALIAPLALGGLAGGSFGPPIAKRISSPMLINLVIAAFIIGAIGLILKHVPFHH